MKPGFCLLSTAYFPPIEFFVQLMRHDKILIERCENFQKQSYRNRCHILSPNGKLALSVPVSKGNNLKMHTCDMQIVNKQNWRLDHWRAIETAYNNSAFFLYYKDAIFELFKNEYSNLFEFNDVIIRLLASILEIDSSRIAYTENFKKEYSDNVNDYRDRIHPKKQNILDPPPSLKYFQVFEGKFNFIYNLSIIDLLFNEGPQSYAYLLKLSQLNNI